VIAGFRKLAKALAALCALAALSLAAQPEAGQFAIVDVFVASTEPVAAWQIELRERRGAMQVVGIERGDDPTFRDPPFFDRVVLERGVTERLVLASFSLSDAHSAARQLRGVARVHVRTTGAATADYELRLVAVGAADGRPIDAELSFETQAGR